MSEEKSSRINGVQGLLLMGLLLMGLLSVGLAGCTDYTEHRDTVTMRAGDAQAWNKTIHTADPWPPYVMNTRIHGDGQRTAAVIRRYSTGNADAAASQPAVSQPAASAAPSSPAGNGAAPQ